MTTLVSDSFNRGPASSLGTADTGQVWVNNPSSPLIQINSSNQAQAIGNTSSTTLVASVNAGVSDYDVSITLSNVPSNGAAGLIIRNDGTSSQACYFLRINGSNYEFYIYNLGSTSKLASQATGLAYPANNVTLRLVAQGSTITAYANGTQLFGQTFTTAAGAATTNTYVGLRAQDGTTTYDNFVVNSVGGTTPTGSITASGSTSTTISGTPVVVGSITASGTSSASVTGSAVPNASITASGTSSVTITGTAIVEGSISASGTSSVSITGSAVSGDSISAQGTSTVTVNGFSVPIGQLSAQGMSSVNVSGHTIVMGSVSAQGTSSASISGTAVSNASITAQGSSSVSISGVPIVTASITAHGVSSVTIESSGAVFGSITAGGTSVIDIEGHTVIVGQINAQGTAMVVVSTAKPIRAIISLVSSLDNKPSLTSSLDNRINLQSGVTPLAAVNQNFNLWQYSSDQITFTHSGDLSGSTLEWIMQPNVLSATPTIKKTSADGSISITSTSANQSVYVVTITNTDMASVTKGNYFHQATVVDGQHESNPICQGTVTVLGASNN